jgi:hypothetical protein
VGRRLSLICFTGTVHQPPLYYSPAIKCTHTHRAIIEGQLDVHPTLNAIVVHYQMDAVVVSVYGEPMVAETKECRKL